jgi:hypothetical protein
VKGLSRQSGLGSERHGRPLSHLRQADRDQRALAVTPTALTRSRARQVELAIATYD